MQLHACHYNGQSYHDSVLQLNRLDHVLFGRWKSELLAREPPPFPEKLWDDPPDAAGLSAEQSQHAAELLQQLGLLPQPPPAADADLAGVPELRARTEVLLGKHPALLLHCMCTVTCW